MIRYFTRELADLFGKGKLSQYKKGEIIIDPNEKSTDVYYIEEGYVKAYLLTEDGDNHLHVIYRPKKIFPLRGAILDMPGNSFYEAITDVTVRSISKDLFINTLESNHSLAMIVLRKTTALFDDYVTKVSNLQFTDTHSRLISMLIYFAERFSEEDGDTIIVTVPLTHQDLANLCNMSRETVSRIMKSLEEKSILNNENQQIVIKDIEALKAELAH